MIFYQTQQKNFNTVLDVLTRYKASEIEESMKKLSSAEMDTLMKYIYRGFSEPTENSCGILLAWHQHVRHKTTPFKNFTRPRLLYYMY